MTARVYDIYDLNQPFVTPTALAAAVVTAQTGRPYAQRLAESRLFNGSVILAVFASALYLLGTFLDWFPIGQVLPFENFGLWFGVVAGGLALAAAMTAVLVATVLRWRQ